MWPEMLPVPFHGTSAGAMLWIFAVYAFGFYIRGAFGFGSNLPIVLLTTWLLGPHHAVLLVVMVATIMQLNLFPQGARRANWRLAAPIIGAIFAGNAVGVWVLLIITADWMLLLLGILVFTMVMMDRAKVLVRLERVMNVRSTWLAVSLAGLSSIIATISGGGAIYFLAPYLKLASPDAEAFRNMSLVLAGSSMLGRVLMLSAAGLISFPLIVEAVVLVPITLAGAVAGARFFRSADPARFFAALQWLLLCAALILALRGVVRVLG